MTERFSVLSEPQIPTGLQKNKKKGKKNPQTGSLLQHGCFARNSVDSGRGDNCRRLVEGQAKILKQLKNSHSARRAKF